MSVKRVVDINFWNDEKVMEQFTPEDKLFMLYLLTNPHTTQLGIYAINKKSMAFELGYSLDTINVLLDRFENKYNMIKYSNDTREIAIKNYLKYSIVKGGKPVEDCLEKEIKQVKDKKLLIYIFNNIINFNNINITVNNIINKYINIYNNINENDVSYHDSYNDSLPKNNFEDEFEELWKLYPKKVGKQNALKDFVKYRKNGDTFETIKEGLKKYISYCNNTKWYSPKDGSTWFHKRSWNDEYETNNKETEEEWFNRMEREVKGSE